MFLIALVWAYSRDRTTPAHWNLPLTYSGDSLLQLSEIKASEEGDYSFMGPLGVSRLGAPYDANWNDYPMQDRLVRTMIQWLAFALGTFPASNLAMMLAHVTAGVSFYLCSRYLRHRWEWAFVGAVLFGLSYFQFWRGIHHMLLSWTYALPMGLLSIWMIGGSNVIRWKDKRGAFVLISSALVGFGNPYYIGMYLQLLGLAWLYRLFKDRQKENLVLGALATGVTIGAFLLMNAGVFAFKAKNGAGTEAVVRHYYQAEQFALKPMDLLMPPSTHQVAPLRKLGEMYASTNKVEGELFSPYLGWVALASLGWMVFELFQRRFRRSGMKVPTHALQVWWVLVYSVVGGLNTMMALGGMQLLRASNRMSLFIFMIALFFCASKMSVWSREKSRKQVMTSAMVILLIGIIDQVPRKQPEAAEHAAAMMAMDEEFYTAVEEALGGDGALFQLPVVGFPETRPPHLMTDYEHLRPYLHTSGLRFSFGSHKGRERDFWQESITRGAPNIMVAELETMGFKGILLNRRGYSDGGQTVLNALAVLGKQPVGSSRDGNILFIPLVPRGELKAPNMTKDARILMAEGWGFWTCRPDRGIYWVDQHVTANVIGKGLSTGEFELSCLLLSRHEQTIEIRLDGEKIFSRILPQEVEIPVTIPLMGQTDDAELSFLWEEEPTPYSESFPELTSGAIMNLRVVRKDGL